MRHGGIVTTCEDSCGDRGAHRMLECESDAGASPAGSTAANRIHYHQDRAVAGSDQPVYIRRSPCLLHAVLRKVRTHGSNELFWVSHRSDFSSAAPHLAESKDMVSVQIFGVKNSPATRAAERFFKERRIAIHFVDLKQKPMSAGEIRRFVEKFGLPALVDRESVAYVDGGLKYLKLSDAELLGKIEREPKLLKLPLVRGGNKLSVGQDEEAWKSMLAAPVR